MIESVKILTVIEIHHTQAHSLVPGAVSKVVGYYALDGSLLAARYPLAEAATVPPPSPDANEPEPPETEATAEPAIAMESYGDLQVPAPRSFRFLDGNPHDFDCPRLRPENRQGNTTICCKAEADRQKAAGG